MLTNPNVIAQKRPAVTMMPDGTKVVRTVCHLCHGQCGIVVHVKDGRIVRVEGDQEHPNSLGSICPKPLAAKQIVYHPDRLKYPMKRAGERGENKWQRISWDEALDTIASKLTEIKREFGAEAVSLAEGTERGHIWCINRFCNTFGTPNWVGPGEAQCYFPRITTCVYTLGAININQNVIDAENTRCIVMWGINPLNGAMFTRKQAFFDALEKGAKLISVDPIFTNTAAKADLWLQPRPATDCALMLGWLNVIINEGLYDKEFIEKWTIGFDKLREHVKEWTPERVAEITWVPAKDIIKAARMYATIKPAMLDIGVAVDQYPNSINSSRAAVILAAITGNVDVPGGNVYYDLMGTIASVKSGPGWGSDDAARFVLGMEQEKKRLGGDKYKLLAGIPGETLGGIQVAHTSTWLEAIQTGKPYPVKALLVFASNLLSSMANINHEYEIMKKLDFIVVTDLFPTPLSSLLGDIVLPAASMFEREDLWDTRGTRGLGSGASYLFSRPKCVEPVGEAWDDKKIFCELAKRLGLEKYWWKDVREVMDWWVAPLGITYEDLLQNYYYIPFRPRKYETEGFRTKTGKLEIYSERLEKLGYDPLPVFAEPPESPYSKPELAKEYPLILTSAGRSPLFMHSEQRNIPWLREIHPDPILDINTETAEKLGIKNGDWVIAESPRGKIRLKARTTLGIHPGVVAAERWWYPERLPHFDWNESNVNVLTSDEPPFDPAMGTYQLRGVLCRVKKA